MIHLIGISALAIWLALLTLIVGILDQAARKRDEQRLRRLADRDDFTVHNGSINL